MKNKVIGLTLVLHPIVIWSAFFKFDLDFFWFLKDNFKRFDLLYSVFSFGAFSLGLWLIVSKARIYSIFAFWMMFVFYQTAMWGFSNNRYLSKVALSPDVSFALIRYDYGAVSSDNFVKLEKFERKFFLFVARKELKQFSNVKKASISLTDDLLTIDMTYFNNKKAFESLRLKAL